MEQAWQRWKERQPQTSDTLATAYLQKTPNLWPQPPAVPPLPGYEKVTRVGAGGMGEVYKAFDPRLKRWVALKQILLHKAGADNRARFRLEAEALARLAHPHIVKVHGFADSGDQPVIEMEFVPGGSLEERLKPGPLPPAEAARLVAILAWAVHAAHDKGIVHRDLKPANVLMDATVAGNPGNVLGGFPKISDFGLAALSDARTGHTLSGELMGTPAYMSPEQAAGRTHDIGPPTDVWALGVILYRCLTGVLPFKDDSVLDTLERVKTMQLRPLRELNPALPPDVAETCMACLCRAPGDRPTAAALAMRLDSLAGGGEGPPPGPLPPRSRWWLVAAGLAAACLLAVGVWLAKDRGTPRNTKDDGTTPGTPAVAIRGGEEGKGVPVVTMQVEQWEAEENKKTAPLGVIGSNSFETRYGEGVVVKVKLSQPAHCFLIACNCDGKPQLLWPCAAALPHEGDANRAPAAVSVFQYPPPSQPNADGSRKVKVFPLNDDVRGGMQGFVVVAARQPLPSYAEWAKGRGALPWTHLPPREGVELNHGGREQRVVRGQVKEWEMKSPLPAVTGWAKTPGVDVVEAVLFPVSRREDK